MYIHLASPVTYLASFYLWITTCEDEVPRNSAPQRGIWISEERSGDEEKKGVETKRRKEWRRREERSGSRRKEEYWYFFFKKIAYIAYRIHYYNHNPTPLL